jgi:hypothetical protein
VLLAALAFQVVVVVLQIILLQQTTQLVALAVKV